MLIRVFTRVRPFNCPWTDWAEFPIDTDQDVWSQIREIRLGAPWGELGVRIRANLPEKPDFNPLPQEDIFEWSPDSFRQTLRLVITTIMTMAEIPK